VPVWIGAMAKKCNKILYTRVQRLMNIKIAKAYQTTSGEALSVFTGITPIEIKVAETKKPTDYTTSQETDKTVNWTTKKSRKIGPIRHIQNQRTKSRKGTYD